MREQLLSRLAIRIAPGDPDTALESLAQAPELQGDLSWLGAIFSAGDHLPLPAVPSELNESLIGIFRAETQGGQRREVAMPIHDSRTAGQLVGVHGDHSGEGWTTVLTAVSSDVIVDGLPVSGGLTEISGQMLARTPGSHSFRVKASGPRNREVSADALGQFDLGVMPAGTYQMVASCTEFDVSWTTQVGDS